MRHCAPMPRRPLSFFFAILLAPLALSAAIGCDKSASSTDGAPSASASAATSASAAPTPPPTAAEPAMPPPDNLDVAGLQKSLKCAGNAKSGPCRVVAQFATCKEWNPVSPSGDARWIGQGFVVEGAKTTEIVSILRAKRVPTSEIGAGQLPVKIGLTELAKEEGTAYDQADRAIRSYERGDIPSRSSPTLEYLKKRESWPDAFAVRTVGGQVYAITQAGTFACLGPKQQLYVVQRASTSASSGDGVYAELWATSW